jgi:hypothetical protein
MGDKENRPRRWRRRAVVPLAVVAAATVALPAGAVADQDQPAAPRAVGGNTSDLTGDRKPDLLVRHAINGDLLVYPHSGTFQGTATYQRPVTVAHGWSGYRWIGTGRFADQRVEDEFTDIVAVDDAGQLVVADNTGVGIAAGDQSFRPPRVLGTGWQVNDLIIAYDYYYDGFTDLIARPAGTRDLYLYVNKGYGQNGFEAPVLLTQVSTEDEWLAMGDVTLDGGTDVIFQRYNGDFGAYSLADHRTYTFSFAISLNALVAVTDIDGDRRPDLIARSWSWSELWVQRHSGTWQPNSGGYAHDAFLPARRVGYGFGNYDWMT